MKLCKFFIFILSFYSSYSQEALVLKAGRNFTQFNYTDKQGVPVKDLIQTDVGNWFFLGCDIPLYKNRYGDSLFLYEFGTSIGDYNSNLGIKGANYKWKTSFISIENSIIYSIIKLENFNLSSKVGFNVGTIIYGKQEINGILFDIKNADGFRGVTFQGVLGVNIDLFPSREISYSIGYDIMNSLNTTVQAPEKLSLSTNRVWFGLILNLNH
jgi:hypothetical protein